MVSIQDYKIEKFQCFRFDSKLSNFNIRQNTIIFFDLENNHFIDNYIENQYSELQEKFEETDKNFIYLSELNYPNDIGDLLKFYLPYLTTSHLQQFDNNNRYLLKEVNQLDETFNEKLEKPFRHKEYQSILDYIGYEGGIKCGFIFFDYSYYWDYDARYNTAVLEYNDFITRDNPEIFFDDLISFFKIEKKRKEEADCMIGNSPGSEFYENLDEDAKEKIREIQNQLMDLKNSGQLLFALPILKNILNGEANAIQLNSLSRIQIGTNYKISLPYFNNLEIQLSHLTKAVYILFYNNPQGINIKELYKYKNELLSLYSKISNQLDYDKMSQSIEDLVNPESKAIYTHISRIKATFFKQMDYMYAKHYIIDSTSHGNDLKYISILKVN